MAWVLLALTIGLEVVGSTMMKLSNGMTVFWPSVGVFIFYGLALTGLTFALKYIELSIAYAIWSGAGTALIAIIGIWYFGESLNWMKVVSLAMVIAGVVGLQLASNA
ncbi:MAG: multidrug efflux SMR transporter [Pseudomonadota bacterium]